MSDEATVQFPCFGGSVSLHVYGSDDSDRTQATLQRSRERLLAVHARLSRFIPDSELSRLNRSALPAVAASPLLCLFGKAVVSAAQRSSGLVDATQLGALERAGYATSLEGGETLSLEAALAAAPPRRVASADPASRWQEIEVDADAGAIHRPPGTRLDSGGIAKGMAADLVAGGLGDHPIFAVDCAGDLRVGGAAQAPRQVMVDDPFGGDHLHEFQIVEGAVATSGIGRRAWLRPDGRPAHHLLDPGTGEPAFTGVVQVTAIAPTAQLAEVLAKTALLRGTEDAAAELPWGGLVVFDDHSFDLVHGRPLDTPLAVPHRLTARA